MAGENEVDDPQNPDVSRETLPGDDDPKPEDSPKFDYETEKVKMKEELNREFKGWLGQRDKALFDELGKKFEGIEQKISTYTHTETQTAEFDYENPQDFIRSEFTKLRQEESSQQKQFQESVLNGMGNYMDNNPLFQDQEFGKAVLETAIKNVGNANQGVDGTVAGQMLIQEATMQVIAAQKEGTNALSGRPASNAPAGSVNPPAGGLPKKEVTMPKLSEHAQKLVDRHGYSAEDVIKILGDE